jgi:hypothetical protein
MLTVSGPVTATASGTVIQDRKVNGCITVNAANVTVRNVEVHCNDGTGSAQKATAPCPSPELADADTHHMQAPRRHHEAHAVEHGALARRELCPVRVPVEDGERHDQRRRRGQGRPQREHDRHAEHEGGRGDPELDAGERHAHEPQHSAHRHDHRERDGQ